MKHENQKMLAFALAVLMTAMCLAACNANAVTNEPTDPPATEPQITDAPTTEAPTTEPPVVITTDPTKPADGPTIDQPFGPNVLGTAALNQIRLGGYDKDWVADFGNILGEFAVISDYDSLVSAFDAVEGLGRAVNFPGEYDAAFFAENRLVLIPMASGSGSIAYVADAVMTNGTVRITLEGRMPEVGTTDMADWLLLIVLPLDQFPGDLPVEIQTPDKPVSDVQENMNITDR